MTIRLHNVSMSFRTGTRRKIVADRLSMEFRPRQCVAILGRNGAGKSRECPTFCVWLIRFMLHRKEA
ncbi:hypothetical protein [Celeribacter indicus]|uniref:Uncharacterized protein n=1 Tax=Celeribacter indicus TaxID=1208324 RepID=A0A0B5DVF8_9RHOB|nr:hypothetical protein [Celeribacter indicus]AJE44731.1 hypothetical protein P73_0016 [Celeribacter indicus]SDX60541.1 hypothetical protein SAMN05443573_1518 [Celeribacter indicus]